MKKLAALLFGLSTTTCALAQEARSPDELAKFVRAAIEAKDMQALARLVHPSASSTSVDRFKGALEAYYGAENLAVFPVPKDDAQAVHKFASMSALPNFKPLGERVRQIADNKARFALMPLGDLAVSGNRGGAGSTASVASAMYGRDNVRYFIIFANAK